MSNFTTFFPSASGGGGGGSILKEYNFTTSSTLNLTTLGIANGDTIYVFLVGGGSGGRETGSTFEGGSGGAIWRGPVTLGTAGTVTVAVGAGGLYSSNGGATTITGGGITGTISTGAARYDRGPLGGTAGIIYNGQGGQNANPIPASGIDGYGPGGTLSTPFELDTINNTTLQNTGRGGKAENGNSQLEGVGFSGIVKIFYS